MKILGILLALSACATKYDVADRYRDNAAKTKAPQTLVFFLVDGLSVPTAQKMFSQGLTPEMSRFFLAGSSQMRVGRAVFPTLTHVNISSILTSRNVDRQPIIGNKIRWHGQTVDFESPLSQKILSDLIRPYSIFTEMEHEHRTSVSIAAYYGDQATARYPQDLNIGLAYREGDLEYIDGEFIDSLQRVFQKTSPEHWPEFIFVHLVGIDSISHKYGPDAPQVMAYARFLDTKLSPIFAAINKANTEGHGVGVIMTADHGMRVVPKSSPITAEVSHRVPGAVVVNQGRFLTLSFAPQMDVAKRQAIAADLSRLPGVESSVLGNATEVNVFADGKSYALRMQPHDCGVDEDYAISFLGSAFLCPPQVDTMSSNFFYPYFATEMVSYFRAPNAPDLMLVAKPDVTFGSVMAGNHGGPTVAEVQVPVLTHNVTVTSGEATVRSFQLLRGFR